MDKVTIIFIDILIIFGRRRVGRPKFRWMDGIIEDVKRLKITNWWMAAGNREAWRKILREAVIRPGWLSQI